MVDAYATAFDARCEAADAPGTERVDEPGVRGLVSRDVAAPTQLLVLDDRALPTLAALLPGASAGTVRVRAAAPRCTELLRRDGSWTSKDVTAMVCPDLAAVPDLALPAGLALRPVRRGPGDPADAVPLRDAVVAACRAAPEGELSVDELAAYLRSLPGGPRIFAAVDTDGVVRGTSGSRMFAAEAYVFLVNTDPRWRRRGVGLSMTAVALRSARDAGARHACLDASGAGVPLYRRLGFTPVGPMTQYSR